VHDDHYVMVNHDLVVYSVIVISVTSNKQLNYQFYKLLVMDNDMTANSSCTSLLSSCVAVKVLNSGLSYLAFCVPN